MRVSRRTKQITWSEMIAYQTHYWNQGCVFFPNKHSSAWSKLQDPDLNSSTSVINYQSSYMLVITRSFWDIQGESYSQLKYSDKTLLKNIMNVFAMPYLHSRCYPWSCEEIIIYTNVRKTFLKVFHSQHWFHFDNNLVTCNFPEKAI